MLSFSITRGQLSFIVVSAIIGVGLIVLAVFLLRNLYYKKHFDESYYKKIYKMAVLDDYYLINHFTYTVDESTKTKIDHILFGDKFIYVIICKYFEGDVSGKYNDRSLIFQSKSGKNLYTPNPINEIKTITTNLSMISGIDPDYMIGLVVVNDNCRVAIQSDSKQFYVIQKKRIDALVHAIESRPLGKMNEKRLYEAVHIINKLNEKNNG
ncbi:MAG: NERD domain-containing protein [Bacilli bacterium]|nr:NERD domain-containing protein [Bacilli bacterium]